MNNQNWMLLSGAVLGASAMYLMDPRDGSTAARAATRSGGPRDAQDRGRARCARPRCGEPGAGSRGGNAKPDARRFIDARKLQERVRAELGRVVSHPQAIDVYVSADGCVCLTGPVLMEEADSAISAIQSVKGVQEVDDRLERYATTEHAPSLQADLTQPGRRSALMQSSWSPTTKALVCLGSTALAVGLGYAATSGNGRIHDLESVSAS